MSILPIGLRGAFSVARPRPLPAPASAPRGFGHDAWAPRGGSGDALAALDRNGDGYLSGNEIPAVLQAHAYRSGDGRMILTREKLAQSGWTAGPPAPSPYAPAPQPYAPAPQPYAPAPQPYAPAPQPYAPAPQPYAPAPQPYAPAPQPYAPAPQPYAPTPQPQPYAPAPTPYAPPAPQPIPPTPAPQPISPTPPPTPAGPSFEALGLRTGANLTIAPGTRVRGFKIEGQAQMRQISANTLVADAQISAAMGFVKKRVTIQCTINPDGTLSLDATDAATGKPLMNERMPILPSAPGTLVVQGPEGRVALQGDGRGGLIAEGPAGRVELNLR